MLAIAACATAAAPHAYSSNGGCFLGEECKPAVGVLLTYQGWGDHIVYMISMHISKWRADATMSVLISGQPALQSVGHPSGCRIVQSSENSLSVVLEKETSDYTCSAVLQASRVRCQ